MRPSDGTNAGAALSSTQNMWFGTGKDTAPAHAAMSRSQVQPYMRTAAINTGQETSNWPVTRMSQWMSSYRSSNVLLSAEPEAGEVRSCCCCRWSCPWSRVTLSSNRLQEGRHQRLHEAWRAKTRATYHSHLLIAWIQMLAQSTYTEIFIIYTMFSWRYKNCDLLFTT